MIGIGVDLCSISKIEKCITQNPRFLQKYYSPSEQRYLEHKNQSKFQSAAAMFAAKEAFLKAFGLGIGELSFAEISLEHEPSGRPYIQLSGKAKNHFESHHAKSIHVALSHEGDMAVAILMVE